MRHLLRTSCLASTLFVAAMTQAQTSPSESYHVSATWKLGGEGRWDYLVVGENHQLYVTRSTHTEVIDTTTGKLIADIAGGAGLHGTAIVPSANRGFITDGKDAKILVFDLKTNAMLGKIDAAEDADGIIYDPSSDRVLVSCGDAAQMLVLDPKADLATAKVEKVDVGGKPEFLAADGKGHAFVCINDKNEIAVVDLKTLKITDRWPTGSGTAPTGLAIDVKGNHLFVGCRNQKLIVINTTDGKVTDEIAIGKGNDACAFDPATGEAFASCGDSTVTAVAETSPGKFGVKQTIETKLGARTMAVDPETHILYLPTAEFAPVTEKGKRPTALPDSFTIVVVTPGK